MAFCPVCGSNEREPMTCGDICECCFNEVGFEDDKSKQEILENFCKNDIGLLYEIAPETENYAAEDILPVEVVDRFLRLIWIQQGCYHFKRINLWDKKRAIKQLKNIDINFTEELEKQADKLARITRDQNGNLKY